MSGKNFIIAYNAFGREMKLSHEDYTSLLNRGFKFSKVFAEEAPTFKEEIKEKVKSDKIGVYLQRFVTGEKNCASDRIRGEWIIKNSDKFELYREGVEYKAVIFHKAVSQIAKTKETKILDICDAVWKDTPNFFKLIDQVDAIITSTEGLKRDLSKLTNKKIYVVDDGHDFEYYETREENTHTRKAKEVVWFGYAQNSNCLAPYMRTIKENGLKLTAIAQCPFPPIDKADKFVKWDLDTVVSEISKADFAVLPVNGSLKSNNKDITAYLSGIPVAKNEKDIIRLIDPKERRKDLDKSPAHRYNAKNIANRYLEIIDNVRSKATVYTAICGDYEKKREDIKVFSEEESFKRDVMNAKIYKVLSHKYVTSPYSIWLDGNISLAVDQSFLVELLGDYDIALFSHPHRTSVYQEHKEAIKRLPEELKPLMDRQIKDYRSEGLPENNLCECGVLIRKESPIVEEFNNRWWAEICKYQHRDQISFPYVWWKMQDRIKIKVLEGNVRSHKYFKYEEHKKNN